VERYNRQHPLEEARVSHLEHCLIGNSPIVAATDYVRAYPQLIAAHVNARFVALGTDGFGRSDTRAALRDFFEVDRHHIALAALSALVRDGRLQRDVLKTAIDRYSLDTHRADPWEV
jgi:pyruvate dehydrogenase E1 component